MTQLCGKCKSSNIFSGSWSPERCMNCGASESGGYWYYDKTVTDPTIAEIQKKSGYALKRTKAHKHKVFNTRQMSCGGFTRIN